MKRIILTVCVGCTMQLLFGVFPIFAQDSLNVTMLGRLYQPWCEAVSVELSGDYAYIADEEGDLEIVKLR